MLNLIEDIIDVSKIESNQLVVNVREYDVIPIINQIIHSFKLIDKSKNKGTLAKSLYDFFWERGKTVCMTREPGGTRLGRQLRELLLDSRSDIGKATEMFLFQADRAHHIDTVIKPALSRNEVVICDRFVDSTFAYQGGGRGWDLEMLKRLYSMASEDPFFWPDVTFILDLPVELSLERANKRNAKDGNLEKEGKFEGLSSSFHQRVRDAYLMMSRTGEHYHIIDASGTTESVFHAALERIREYIS